MSRKFKKNIITHQSTQKPPFIVDFFKILITIVVIALAAVGAYALIVPETQEIIFDRLMNLMQLFFLITTKS